MKSHKSKYFSSILCLLIFVVILLKKDASYTWLQNSLPLSTSILDLDNFNRDPEVPYVAPDLPIKVQKYDHGKRDIEIFAALCDERMMSFSNRTAVHFFVFIQHRIQPNNETRERLRSTWKCRMFYENGDSVDVPLSGVFNGFAQFSAYLSCFFDSSKYSCPSEVSLVTDIEEVNNRVSVARQEAHEGDGLTFCGSTLRPVPGSGFDSWHQFVEWMEYMRLVGVSQVVLPEPLPHPLYQVSNELLTAMDFYKKKGFLKTFSGVYHLFYVPKNITNVTQVTDRSWFYKILGHNTLWMYNYCYLKYGTKYSHVQIGDSDEMPLFNFTKYGNIMNAIRDTEMVYKERRGEDLESFVMGDNHRLMRCKTNETKLNGAETREILVRQPKQVFRLARKFSIEDVLKNDSRILSRHLESVFKNSCGKSIYRVNFSLQVWYHWNWIKLSEVNYFKDKSDVSDLENFYMVGSSKRKTMQGRQAVQIVEYYHSRLSGTLSETDEEYCSHPENWKNVDYLDQIREKLFFNIFKTSREAGLFKS